jgi:hypothetical protein
VGAVQKTRYRERRRRFAGAADGQIAEADHRHAGGVARRLHTHCSDRTVNGGKRCEKTSCAGLPPEGRRAHQSMIPKKPARDLIRGGCRFSEKIMLN